MVATTMKCILAQRLSRRICPDCKQTHDPTPDEIEAFKVNNYPLPAGAKLYHGAGCDSCKGGGFKGRCGIHELLIVDDAVRLATLKDVSADSVRTAALTQSPQKFRTILQDGLSKALQGMTTVREVLGGAAEDASKKK
jgi:type II secretory ATPase GspE/PulE/Tfp pilus assembly ATPase PilB-like protein